jgi:hypothetical protein
MWAHVRVVGRDEFMREARAAAAAGRRMNCVE